MRPHALGPVNIWSTSLSAGDPKYEDAAVTSLVALWRMRTHLSLFGTSINITTAQWVHSNGGTGAGADSFFEYLLKAYILFSEPAPLLEASAKGRWVVLTARLHPAMVSLWHRGRGRCYIAKSLKSSTGRRALLGLAGTVAGCEGLLILLQPLWYGVHPGGLQPALKCCVCRLPTLSLGHNLNGAQDGS